jgi:hypothetical protein
LGGGRVAAHSETIRLVAKRAFRKKWRGGWSCLSLPAEADLSTTNCLDLTVPCRVYLYWRRRVERHSPSAQSTRRSNQFINIRGYRLSRKPCRINTCKSVSKQMTLTLFRINTYEKHRGRGVDRLGHAIQPQKKAPDLVGGLLMNSLVGSPTTP